MLSGAGRYADPWHDFAGTSARVADLLREQGLETELCDTEDDVVAGARLIVVNAGGGGEATVGEPGDAGGRWRDLVLDHALSGHPVLALHAATNTFYDDERWPQVCGGRWVPGTSMHPPLDTTTVQVTDARHPITAGLQDFVARDERYSRMEVHPSALGLVTHVFDDRAQPIVWVHTDGGVRVVVDCFGHDVPAYGLARPDLLRREVQWLLA